MLFRCHMIRFLFVAILIVSLSPPAAADDNEIFGIVAQTVEPNVFILFDTSFSMRAIVPDSTFGDTYAPDTLYRESDYYNDFAGTVREDRIYIFRDKDGDNAWDSDETGNAVDIEDSDNRSGGSPLTLDDFDRTDDTSVLYYTGAGSGETTLGEFKSHQSELEQGGWVTIDGRQFALGNWINWHKNRNEAAIHAIQNIIEIHGDSLRFGIMRFDSQNNEGGYIHSYKDTELGCSLKDAYILDADGRQKTGPEYDTAITDYKSFLKEAVKTLPANGKTPLKETLAEAGLYFAEKASWFNRGVDYGRDNLEHNPMQYRCRQNYIILMTDGKPRSDENDKLRNGQYINGDIINGDENRLARLDDIAQYLYEQDCNSWLTGQQNIVTYTIGFAGGDEDMLQSTADKGQGAAEDEGLYFPASNQKSLEAAFQAFTANIREQGTTFTPSVVPISDVNKAYAGDSVYMSLFKPINGSSRWIGNLKKYKLDENNDFASWDTGAPILDDGGKIRETARSGWSTSDDGSLVHEGGVGTILSRTGDAARNIYTNLDPSRSLTAAANRFSTDNDSLSGSDFGVDTDRTAEVINHIRMVDQDWKLGDLNHSKPAIASYGDGSTPRHILVGSNDGMLHCFNDETGAEAWAFVPKEQFSRITDVYNGDHSYFLDGSPTVADIKNGKKMVIFGERRGGRHYYALDISDISHPDYLYTVTTSGQSWQKPQFIRSAVDASTTGKGFLLTGGYDDAYDDADSLSRPCGNAVFAIAATRPGNELFRLDDDQIPAMTHSIVNARAIDVVDDGRDVVSQIYAGDLEGQLFGFRDNNDASNRKSLDGSWQALHVFSAESSGKKMFEPVDTVLEYMDYYDPSAGTWKTVVGDYVFFGTGDRANPLRKDTTNYFYCVKNDWQTEHITPGKTVGDFSTLDPDPLNSDNASAFVMIDVTDNRIQDGTPEQKAAAREALNARYNRGWYIELEGEGEKCLSTPTVYAGVVYFTTFTPSGSATAANPCDDPAGGGSSRLYAIDYKTGGAVYNDFDGDPSDPLSKDDRAIKLHGDPPIAPDPEVIISFKGEKLTIGPVTRDIQSPGSGMTQFYWVQDN